MIKIFVFDTNSLISANLLPDSVNRTAYDRARKIGLPVYSNETLTEFAETLMRSKFDKYVSAEKRRHAISAFTINGLSLQVEVTVNICRDPKDNKFLELAVQSDAACIITGDKDLLILNPFQNIPIMTAADFLKTF